MAITICLQTKENALAGLMMALPSESCKHNNWIARKLVEQC